MSTVFLSDLMATEPEGAVAVGARSMIKKANLKGFQGKDGSFLVPTGWDAIIGLYSPVTVVKEQPGKQKAAVTEIRVTIEDITVVHLIKERLEVVACLLEYDPETLGWLFRRGRLLLAATLAKTKWNARTLKVLDPALQAMKVFRALEESNLGSVNRDEFTLTFTVTASS